MGQDSLSSCPVVGPGRTGWKEGKGQAWRYSKSKRAEGQKHSSLLKTARDPGLVVAQEPCEQVSQSLGCAGGHRGRPGPPSSCPQEPQAFHDVLESPAKLVRVTATTAQPSLCSGWAHGYTRHGTSLPLSPARASGATSCLGVPSRPQLRTLQWTGCQTGPGETSWHSRTCKLSPPLPMTLWNTSQNSGLSSIALSPTGELGPEAWQSGHNERVKPQRQEPHLFHAPGHISPDTPFSSVIQPAEVASALPQVSI